MAWWKSRIDSPSQQDAADRDADSEAAGTDWASAAASRDMSLEELRDFMAWWVESMDVRLTHFRDFVMTEPMELDFTEVSLKRLADVLMSRYPDNVPPDWSGDKDFLEGILRYLGETFRYRYGGRWSVGDDPQFSDFGEVLIAFDAPIPPLVPRVEVSALLARRDRDGWALVYRGAELWLDEARAERVAQGLPADDPAWHLPARTDAADPLRSRSERSTQPEESRVEVNEVHPVDDGTPPDRMDGEVYLSWWIRSMPRALEVFRARLTVDERLALDDTPESLFALG